MQIFLKLLFILFQSASGSYGETIAVKYRDNPLVLDRTFKEFPLKSSSLVKRILYSVEDDYLVVRLKSSYYHYCDIPEGIVLEWINAASLGRYYVHKIRGRYSCIGKEV